MIFLSRFNIFNDTMFAVYIDSTIQPNFSMYYVLYLSVLDTTMLTNRFHKIRLYVQQLRMCVYLLKS